jgi:hypothetical protein
MKKIIISFIFIFITTTSNSKITKNEISESLKCAGIFTATQFIKQDELPNGDLSYKENSLAAAKVTRDFLSSEGILEENINSGINSTVDEMFGKPYEETLMNNCYAFIFRLIPNGKEKVEEISKTIYGG